jgi:hypothetical protein
MDHRRQGYVILYEGTLHAVLQIVFRRCEVIGQCETQNTQLGGSRYGKKEREEEEREERGYIG